jgi:glycosyltransferase involved in cell wall biosynthesis
MKKEKIILSVAFPVYNGGQNLEKNLDHFTKECNKKKFFNFFELVISDNCSNDNTNKIINKYIRILKRNNFIKIRYTKNKKNLGYPKNFLKVLKNCSGKYVMPLSDDNIPKKGFYTQLYNFLISNNLTELGFAPISSTKEYKNKFLDLNKFSYVVARGSVMSGVILKTKKINLKNVKENLYIHNFIYINYFLKYGMRNIPLRSNIKFDTKVSVSKKFNDRMGRKNDYAVLDKLKIVEFFYKRNKVGFFEYLISISQIYEWCINVMYILTKQNSNLLAKIFFKEILKFPNKRIIKYSFIIILLKKIFSKKSYFISKKLVTVLKTLN